MKTKVVQNQENAHAVEIIADAIVELAKAMKKINQSRLTQDAIVTLIVRNSTGLSRSAVETVLENLDTLEERWLKNPVLSKPRCEVHRESDRVQCVRAEGHSGEHQY